MDFISDSENDVLSSICNTAFLTRCEFGPPLFKSLITLRFYPSNNNDYRV